MAVQIEDATDVGMGYGAGEMNLAFKVGERIGVFDPHGLDGNTGAELEVLSFINVAHATGSDGPQDAIASGEGLAGGELSRDGGRPDPLLPEQADVQEATRFAAVAEHREGFLT